jgi:hypothetical protein
MATVKQIMEGVIEAQPNDTGYEEIIRELPFDPLLQREGPIYMAPYFKQGSWASNPDGVTIY